MSAATPLAPFENRALTSTLVDPINDPRWEKFVSRHPLASPFHQPGWLSAISETFGYKPHVHVLEDSKGEIAAAWPGLAVFSRLSGSRLVTLPFSHGATPLIGDGDQAKKLLKSVRNDADQSGITTIEVRDWPPTVTIPTELRVVHPFQRHVLDLRDGPEAVMARVTKDMRYSIRRADRNGVTVRQSTSASDLELFYSLYKQQRRRQALLPQPFAFIQAIHQRLIQSGRGFLTIAEHNRRPVVALLSVCDGRTVIGTHSGASAESRGLRAGPLAIWKAIETACQRGCSLYDFGRTDGEAHGLRHFKKEWGATELSLPYLFHPEPGGLNSHAPSGWNKRALELYSKFVPEPFFSAAGTHLYRHLG